MRFALCREARSPPLTSPYLPIVPSPTTPCAPTPLCPPRGRCATTAYRTASGLRHGIAGSPQHYAESSSSSYGPTVRLRLLPTPPPGDAVTFGYGAVACSDTDLHRADLAPSRAHDSRFRGNDTAGFFMALPELAWPYGPRPVASLGLPRSSPWIVALRP